MMQRIQQQKTNSKNGAAGWFPYVYSLKALWNTFVSTQTPI